MKFYSQSFNEYLIAILLFSIVQSLLISFLLKVKVFLQYRLLITFMYLK